MPTFQMHNTGVGEQEGSQACWFFQPQLRNKHSIMPNASQRTLRASAQEHQHDHTNLHVSAHQ